MLSNKRKERNREGLGESLRRHRDKSGYTQKALADALGLEYYTMISQMERGYVTIPPAMWLPIAQILRIDPVPWVLMCLEEIQPEVYKALFQNKENEDIIKALELLHKGHLD